MTATAARRRSVPWPPLLLAALAALAAVDAGGASRMQPGERVTDFTLRDSAGNERHLSDFAGKVVLLSFWDCHADACFATTSVLEEFLRAYPPEKLVALAVCSEIPPALAADGYRKLLESCARGQILLIDEQKQVTRLYGAENPPTTLLLDRGQTIKARVEGVIGLRAKEFAEKVATLVGEVP